MADCMFDFLWLKAFFVFKDCEWEKQFILDDIKNLNWSQIYPLYALHTLISFNVTFALLSEGKNWCMHW